MEVIFRTITSLTVRHVKVVVGETPWIKIIAKDKDGKDHDILIFPVAGNPINILLEGGAE